MRKKIELPRDKAIAFMWTMNAIPMIYVMKIQKRIFCFVDASKKAESGRNASMDA